MGEYAGPRLGGSPRGREQRKEHRVGKCYTQASRSSSARWYGSDSRHLLYRAHGRARQEWLCEGQYTPGKLVPQGGGGIVAGRRFSDAVTSEADGREFAFE